MTEKIEPGLIWFHHYPVHPTHLFVPADDIYECADCVCRPYNPEAKEPCPDVRFDPEPANGR